MEKKKSNKLLWIGGLVAVGIGAYFVLKNRKETAAQPLSPGDDGTYYPDDWDPLIGKDYSNDPAYQDWFKRLQAREQAGKQSGVQPVQSYLLPPQPAYVPPAYSPPQVAPAPVETIYVPEEYAPIQKPVYNPEANLQPPYIPPPNPVLQKYPAGTLLRQGNDDKVYQVNSQGERQWITNRKKFDSMGLSMKNVRSISASEMNSIPMGSSLSGIRGLGAAYLLN